MQREPVVGGDEVDARVGAPPGRRVQVRTSSEARRELGERLVGSANEVAERIAILAVPLGP